MGTMNSLFAAQDKEIDAEKYKETPPVDFDISLADGTPVHITFKQRYFFFSSHFEFHGDITSTGYRSHFTGEVLEWTQEEIHAFALQIAEECRRELLRERAKAARVAARKPRKKAPAEKP